MNFNQLEKEQKNKLHDTLSFYTEQLGGINLFLKMLEEIRESKPKALLNKTAIFHTSNAKILWGKTIFKDNLNLLYSAMINEEKNGNIFKDLVPKDYKNTMNMVRSLHSIELTIEPKDTTKESFSFMMFDTSIEKNTKIDMIFKIIFLFSIDFAKQVLAYTKS